MIKHIVTFKLKGPVELRKDKASQFRDALLALPGRIDCLRSMEVGLNVNPAEDWDLVLTAVVDNWEDLDTYSSHPLHLAAASIIKDCKESRACVDYIIEK
ncbi:MAG: Dabb family protein [Muribaculaceae bacterium]|nr:Dabb family protein [Muribaculaceae bacterium]